MRKDYNLNLSSCKDPASFFTPASPHGCSFSSCLYTFLSSVPTALALSIFEAIFIVVWSLPCINFAGLEMPVELFIYFSLVMTETVSKYRQISPERLNSPFLRTKDYYIHLFLLWQFATGIKLFSPNLKEIVQCHYLCCKTKAHDDFMIYKEGYILTA